jgi:sucrose phosphorylase
MKSSIRYHLESLYGQEAAKGVMQRLTQLVDEWRSRLPPPKRPRQALNLCERDSVLITYADQLTEAGEVPLGVLADFCNSYLKGMVSSIHLLPFYPSSSDDGFSVKDFFAVEPNYGTWEDIGRLGTDFDLMFDAVFNHVSAQGEWFQHFLAQDAPYRDFFVCVDGEPDLSQVVRPRALPLLTEFTTAAGARRVWTTFSADQVDLNFKSPEVLLRVIDALLFYCANGARFIRLDAIAFLWKELGTSCLHLPQTHRIIQLLRAVLDEAAPAVLLITETNVPHRENVTYFGDGTNEAQLVYNFALPPLVLHSFSAGQAESLSHWAQSLTLPSRQVTFFNFLASHDGIGINPVRGILTPAEIDALARRTLAHGGFISYKDTPGGGRVPYELNINYLDALSDPTRPEPVELAARKSLTAHAILLSLQGVPGIYFHSLFGSRGDRPGADSSGISRRINREKLDRVGLERRLREPGSLRASVFGGMRGMLSVRSQHAAFSPEAWQQVITVDPRVFTVLRQDASGADVMLCLHNVSPERVPVGLRGVSSAGLQWKVVWGGIPSGSVAGSVVLEPYESLWLAPA